MKIFNLPDLGEGLAEAEIQQWHVQAGDVVKADDVIVSLETAKALVDIPSPYSGTISKLYGQAGDIIKTGKPLVEFTDVTENLDKGTVAGQIEIGDTILIENPQGINNPKTTAKTVKAIPAVRALAKKLNVDLTAIKASGINSQITVADVEAAASKSTSTGETYQPLRGVRKVMAQTMQQAYAEIVAVTLVDDAMLPDAADHTDITLKIIHGLIAACKAEPALNAWYNTKTISRQLNSVINIGIALDTPDGLFVPVIKNAEQLTADALRTKINTFKEQTNKRSLAADDLRHATITLSNFGTFAGRYATPIVVPPSVAIIGAGRVRKQAVVINDQIAIKKVLPLSLTFDHRAVTGGEAARFLGCLIKNLEG